MYIPKGVIKLDIESLKLIELIEVASSTAREESREEDAVALFRLRIKIRNGLSYSEAKNIFDKHAVINKLS